MKDIENRSDLEVLLNTFYSWLLQDESINYIFIDVAKMDLAKHLPHITDFWEQNLFGRNGYNKNVMQVHLDLNNQEKLTQKHFETWLNHFEKATDTLFSGPNAEKIKTRALSIATVMLIKLQQS